MRYVYIVCKVNCLVRFYLKLISNLEVYTMEPDRANPITGTNPVRLTTHTSDDDYPEWRP